ncbi:MAG: Gfo/Idh/MocA family oxidoreductase [Planctomycetota bacterium]|nr:Gfo/Idh/MocA family oxidoreductase [Planctomycetota bacterium]MDA1140722.1 Gfo/Idh/MocA family oxidoreductase [Planctomycetota bacterium]
MNKIRVAVVGIGGYGQTYVNQFLQGDVANAELVAGIDLAPERYRRLDEMKAAGTAVYTSLGEFLDNDSADLIAIASPIHLHCEHTSQALERGINVLCEKPLTGSIEEAEQMLRAEQASGKFVAIGYQWSFAPAILNLKADIAAGKFGRPLSFRCLSCWPRPVSYYQRNNWAGRIRTEDGRPVLDSPAANAHAHHLHNMLYLLGPKTAESDFPARLTAELYRANDIQNFDFGAFRILTENKVEIVFLSGHSLQYRLGPIFHAAFEEADISYAPYGNSGSWLARMKDGSVKDYGIGSSDKLAVCIEAVRSNGEVPCGIRAAAAHVTVICGALESMPQIKAIPAESKTVIKSEDSELVTVNHLEEVMTQCYEMGLLPSEIGGVEWAASGKEVDMSKRGRMFREAR